MDYYGDNDRSACAWMRELIQDDQIPTGIVDERDIKQIDAFDLLPHRRVHLFAGIGGWAYALRLAGWPEDRPVWTGSCPCQPFSAAGKRKGQADDRHLWPAMFRLIRECRPPTVFGEQVPSAIGFGWLDGVFADLESKGYACGAVVLGAHSVGAPIIRQRLWWVASATGQGPWKASSQDEKPSGWSGELGRESHGTSGRLPGANCTQLRRFSPTWNEPGDRENEILLCTDGRYRRTQSELYPLAARLPGFVAFMRGYGNSIVAKVAAAFIRSFLESEMT